MREMVILGATLQGRVIGEAIEQSEDQLMGFLTEEDIEDWIYPILGKIERINGFTETGRSFIIAEEDLKKREALANRFTELGFGAVVHPKASVAKDAALGAGAYIGAGAVVGPGAQIGAHTQIGEGTIIGAMAKIGSFCQLLSRANIGRQVTVEHRSFIGASATLKDNITIATGTILQTGEIVVKDMVMKMVYKRGAWIYKENGPKQ